MKFLLKRYFYGISKRRFWLLLVFVFPSLYLLLSIVNADRFTVSQSISITDSAPISITSRPTGFTTLKEVILKPDDFFMNSFAVKTISNDIFAKSRLNVSGEQVLIKEIKETMSMTKTGRETLGIKYYGKNLERGKVLVGYYSKRLIEGTNEGLIRSNMRVSNESRPSLVEGLYVIEHRALWRAERLNPLMTRVLLSILGVLILFWVMEWNDSSFKSERQLGRYLNVPVLGSVPDIRQISSMIESGAKVS